MSKNGLLYFILGMTLSNTAHQIINNVKRDREDESNAAKLEVVGNRVASRDLLKAAYKDDVELFKKSLKKGDINARNENGDNFLMIAIENNSNKVLEYILNDKNGYFKHIDPSNVNNQGKTAQSMIDDKLDSFMGYIDGSSKDVLKQLKTKLGHNKPKTSMAFYEKSERTI